MLVKILAEYPRSQRAAQLHEIVDKYHDVKVSANLPLQRNDIIPQLRLDLTEAQKLKAAARTRKPKI